VVRFLGRTGSSLFFERKVGTKLKHPQPASLPGFDSPTTAPKKAGRWGDKAKPLASVATSGPGEQQKGPVSGSLKKC
jgi:hypothetical protein